MDTTGLQIFFIKSFFLWCGSSLDIIPATQKSPCHLRQDSVYGGITVDCQGQGLTSLPPSEWIPINTTSLLLQQNDISHLDNTSFVNAPSLQFLSLANNKLRSIDPLALRLNKNIRVIHLESNLLHLDSRSVRGPLFHELHSLVELTLIDNHNGKLFDVSYSPHLFMGLLNLCTLTMDTFSGALNFNGIFKETRNLTKLTLSGGFSKLRNDTFQDFHLIPLRELMILNAPNFFTTEPSAFQYLQYLDSYFVNDVNQGTAKTLESLAPFVNRNFTTLSFQSLNTLTRDGPEAFKSGVELDKEIARYLSKICVKHFVFTSNYLFFIEPEVISNSVWSKCLITLDISDNPLLGSTMELIRLMRMHTLQTLIFTNRLYSFLNRKGKSETNYGSEKMCYLCNYADLKSARKYACEEYFNNKTRKEVKYENMPILSHINEKRDNAVYHIMCPKNLEYLDLHGFSRNSIDLHADVRAMNCAKLRTLNFRDMGISHFTGSVRGMEQLKFFDISKNDGSQIAPSFVGSFPSLSKLLMSDMKLENSFVSPENHYMFQDLIELEYIDLSHNDLYFVPSTLFRANHNLKYVFLTGNRFKTFPLDLAYTMNLQSLGLGTNSFLQFSPTETAALDYHALGVKEFSLALDGNVFSCSCFSINFLSWLQKTQINLDKNRTYSCVLENGQITTTEEMKNIKSLWRLCEGKAAFYTSVILICLTALAFSLFTLGIKFKTQIKAAIFQYFRKNFALQKASDFPIGVYLGYADQDTDLVCVELRDIIENQFDLTTYIRHRDLLPASSIAESTVSAINSSWRVVLVMTEFFLEDPWSYFAMKTAMYSVGPSNPGRLVIIVLADEIENKIPIYILKAVQEDSIIRMDGEQLTVAQLHALRKALLG